MQFKPIPLIQPSGIQPYHSAGGQFPGPALTAMRNGTTLFGYHPATAQRQSQRQSASMARRRPRPSSLLESLLASR